MKNSAITLFVLLIVTACGNSSQKNAADQEKPGVQNLNDENNQDEDRSVVTVNIRDLKVPVPEDAKIMDTLYGDLNNDGFEELVAVYDLVKEVDAEDGGNLRSIVVYTVKNDALQKIDESKSAVMGSADGGMMGDPYEGIEIKKGVLSINHWGGSSWKWAQTDKYRFQNGHFELIGYAGNYGKLCEYTQTTDYNLSTGKLVFEKEFETCKDVDYDEEEPRKDEKETIAGKKMTVTFKNRYEKEIKITLPKTGEVVYL